MRTLWKWKKGEYEQVGGEADRWMPEHSEQLCPEEWKTWQMKPSEKMNGWKDGRVNGWIVEQLNRVRSYLPVSGVCACAESGAD